LLSYSKFNYLININWWWYIWLGGSPTTIISFVNTTTGYTLIKLIQLNAVISYYNSSAVTKTIVSNYKGLTWYNNSIIIYSDSNIDYKINGTTVSGEPFKAGFVSNGYRIDKIIVACNSQQCFFDDITFILSNSYEVGENETSEYYCGNDVSLYDVQIGDLYGITNFGEIDTTRISSNYGVSIDTTIRGIGLSVDLAQYEQDNNANNYTLYINNQSIGSAECFTYYYNAYGHFYIIYWDVTVRIYNQSVTFMFEHNKQSTTGWYWFVGQSPYSTDLDQDGDSIFYYDASFTQCHWIFLNGFIPFWQCYDITITSRNADLGMTFWCDEISSPPPEIYYNDSLGLSNWNYKNDTGYVYLIPDVSTDGVILSYTLENNLDIYDIYINFTGCDNDGCGYQNPYNIGDFSAFNIPYPDGTYSMIPLYEGKYEFYLEKNDLAVCNITAWIIGNWSNQSYYIFTNPPISNQFDSYDVVYKYNNPNGYFGAIAKFDDILQYQLHGYYGKIDGWDIEQNITETRTVSSYSSTPEYWGLYANKTNGFVLVFPLHTHKIKLFSVIENKIWVLPNQLTIGINNPENLAVVIYYNHRFVGTDISIYINDVFYQNVGDSGSGSRTFIPRTSGLYTVKLKLNQNETLITVAQNTFTITATGGGGGGGGGGGIFNITIPTPYSYFGGIFIIVGFTLSPLLIVAGLGKSTGRDFNISSIPQILYLIMAIVGFIITIVIGWFPVWSVAVLIVLCIVIIVIMWLQKKNVTEG